MVKRIVFFSTFKTPFSDVRKSSPNCADLLPASSARDAAASREFDSEAESAEKNPGLNPPTIEQPRITITTIIRRGGGGVRGG